MRKKSKQQELWRKFSKYFCMIVERIVYYLKQKGVTISAFEREMGFANATLSKAYRTGGSIGSDKIEKIVKACKDLSPSWLLTGDGEMIVDVNERAGEANTGVLPLVSHETAACSSELEFSRDNIEHHYNIRELNNRSDFLIRAKGDDMQPKYNGGDLIACRYIKDVLFFQWGKIYFVCTRSQGEFICRIHRHDDPDRITCASDNPKYASFDIPKSDILSLALVNGAVTFE